MNQSSRFDFSTLPTPARYTPFERGIYDLSPGMRAFGTDYGNGEADRRFFQIDQEFPKYRSNKEACRSERVGKYWVTHDLEPQAAGLAAQFIVDRLHSEYPHLFEVQKSASGIQFSSHLTGETLSFDSQFKLRTADGPSAPLYSDALDALACQFQEDLAIVSRNNESDWLSALHLCSPSHWAAEDKVGRNFIEIHAPVPGIQLVNRAAPNLISAMMTKGPFLRFVWGFATDMRLNHHPEPAPGWNKDEWQGRSFDRSRPGSAFHLRVERQILKALPGGNHCLFLIRVSFVDGDEIRQDAQLRNQLVAALQSMTPESRVYKSVANDFDDLVAWLQEA